MSVYKVVFANNTVVSCEEAEHISLDKDVCYRHNDRKLISAYIHATSVSDAILRAQTLINETLDNRTSLNEIIIIEEQVSIYSEELKQLYSEKAAELRELVHHFQSVEEGASITFWGTEQLGMLSTKIETDGCEDKLTNALKLVCRQLCGSFVIVQKQL